MDWQRLWRMILQRFLAPTTVGALLWIATEYVAFMIGGSLLGVLLLVLARPALEAIEEFFVTHFETLRARRRASMLHNFVRFLLAYKALLTKYPPVLLPALEADLRTQLQGLKVALQDVRKGRMFRSAVLHEVVRETPLSVRDFANWDIYDCRRWMNQLRDLLSDSTVPMLRHAVQRFQQHSDDWESSLAAVEQALDCQATATMAHWHCIQRAQEDPAIRARLCTLLRLEAVTRQGGIVTYLASPHLRCPPEEIADIMDVLRYETVATRLLALLEQPARGERGGSFSAF